MNRKPKPMWRPKPAPAAPVPKVKKPRPEKRVSDRYHWDQEAYQLMEWCHQDKPGYRYKIDLVRFAYATGMRVSEIARCKGLDCDVVGFKIRIMKSKSGSHQTMIAPPFRDWFRRFVAESTGTELLFQGVCTMTLQRWWKDVCHAAGVRDLKGIHGARHTYATWAVASGWLQLHELSRTLGHASYATTVDYYLGDTTIEGKILDGKPPHWWGAAQGIFEDAKQDNVIPFRAVGGA